MLDINPRDHGVRDVELRGVSAGAGQDRAQRRRWRGPVKNGNYLWTGQRNTEQVRIAVRQCPRSLVHLYIYIRLVAM